MAGLARAIAAAGADCGAGWPENLPSPRDSMAAAIAAAAMSTRLRYTAAPGPDGYRRRGRQPKALIGGVDRKCGLTCDDVGYRRQCGFDSRGDTRQYEAGTGTS